MLGRTRGGGYSAMCGALSVLVALTILQYLQLIHITLAPGSRDDLLSYRVHGGEGGFRNHAVAQAQESTLLLVVVVTGADEVERRALLRNTWFQFVSRLGSDKVRAVFVVGGAALTSSLRAQVEREARAYKDLVVLEDALDTYQDLASKVLHAVRWAASSAPFNFHYLLKADLDTFVRLDRIVEELLQRPVPNDEDFFYWGYMDGRATPKQGGAWQETKFDLCDHYLPYAFGGGYIISAPVAHYIARNSHAFSLFISEDVSMGVWVAPLKGLERVHDLRFDTEFKSRGCQNDFLVTHKQSAEEIRAKWRRVSTDQPLCKREEVKRKAYKYDKSVPPSQCCAVRI